MIKQTAALVTILFTLATSLVAGDLGVDRATVEKNLKDNGGEINYLPAEGDRPAAITAAMPNGHLAIYVFDKNKREIVYGMLLPKALPVNMQIAYLEQSFDDSKWTVVATESGCNFFKSTESKNGQLYAEAGVRLPFIVIHGEEGKDIAPVIAASLLKMLLEILDSDQQLNKI